MVNVVPIAMTNAIKIAMLMVNNISTFNTFIEINTLPLLLSQFLQILTDIVVIFYIIIIAMVIIISTFNTFIKIFTLTLLLQWQILTDFDVILQYIVIYYN